MNKKICKIFILLFVIFCSHFSLWGQPVTLIFTQIPHHNHNDESDFGHRIPPKPITAVIDFESNEFSLSQTIENIESYEIWDENQSVILYSGNDESDFVQTVATLSDTSVTILINTTTTTLISIHPFNQ